jgi:hypothetical protein
MVSGAQKILTPAELGFGSAPGPTPGEWLSFPRAVYAPSPFDRISLCGLKIAAKDVRRAARAGRRQIVFDLWSMVIGKTPPVPGVHARNDPQPGELTSIAQAHACFRGIERPLAEDNNGSDVLAYILRPRIFYEYDPNMVSVALKQPVPRDVVFVVYARLFDQTKVEKFGLIGVITHWGFVEVDSADPKLPVNYGSRYSVRLW